MNGIKSPFMHGNFAEIAHSVPSKQKCRNTGARFRSKKIVTKIVMRIVMRCNFDSETCLNFSSHEFFSWGFWRLFRYNSHYNSRYNFRHRNFASETGPSSFCLLVLNLGILAFSHAAQAAASAAAVRSPKVCGRLSAPRRVPRRHDSHGWMEGVRARQVWALDRLKL